MKKLFLLSLLLIATCAQAEEPSPFSTVGNKNLYDHVPPNARKKAKKIGINTVDPTDDKTTVVLKDGKKYFRIQVRNEEGVTTSIKDSESGWLDHDYGLYLWYHKYRIGGAIVICAAAAYAIQQ